LFKAIDKALAAFENFVITLGIFATTFVLFANVIARVFKYGFPWAYEFSQYAIVWIVMAGMGAATRAGVHMRVTALIDMTKSEKFHKIINAVVHVLTALFGLFFLVYGVRLCASMIERHQVSTAMELPLWIVYISLPIGGGLMLLREIQALVRDWKGGENKDKEELL